MSKKKLEFVLSIFTILILFSVSIYISTSISNTNYSFNIFDRILLQSKSLDQSSLLTRTEQYKRSVELFFSSPLIGVGLGNFGNYVNTNKILSTIIDEGTKSYTLSTLTRPHSLVFQILGETGLSGFIPFIMLLFYFLFEDVKNLKFKKHTYTSALILSSWSFILYSLYNPADTIFIMGWFWLFRGIIEGLK